MLHLARMEIRRSDRSIAEADILRAKLVAHHAVHNMAEGTLVGDHCLICKEVDDAR